MKNQLLSFMAIAMIAAMPFTSCTKTQMVSNGEKPQKEDKEKLREDTKTMDEMMEEEGIDADKITIKYFMDGHPITELPTDISDYFPVFSATKNPEERSATITIRMFTSEENYFDYGDEVRAKFREVKTYTEKMRTYAEEMGIDIEDESTEIPREFIDYSHEKYKEYFGGTGDDAYARVTWGGGSFQGWDDIVPSGPTSFFPLTTHPGLLAWNNRLGSVMGVSLYSTFFLYDKSFYRKYMGVVHNWGLTVISFSSYFGLAYFNNRTTSYIHIAVL